MNHQLFMRRCLDLAWNGSGNVAPNPMVGAVLVHQGSIVSEGWHMQYGGHHAEVHAIRNISNPSFLPECTLYVNLEPCSHHGKTPPCSDLIIESGIKKVVICNTDPNPLVSGRGMARLKAAGVEVISGILEAEGRMFNRRFFTFHEQKRPYIILKWAQSAEGFMAPLTDHRKKGITWLSNPTSRSLTHLWRSEEASILVGANTVISDNPQLTVRGMEGKQPIRLILDPDLKCDARKKIFSNQSRVVVFNHIKQATMRNVSYVQISKGRSFLKSALKYLYENGIQSVIVEGGAFTLHSFISQNLWDEARVFKTPVRLDSGIPAPHLKGAPVATRNVLTDQLEYYTNQP